MTNSRSFLLLALLVVGYLLWNQWQDDYVRKPQAAADTSAAVDPTAATPTVPTASDVPAAANNGATPNAPGATQSATAGRRIDVKTDVLHIVFDTNGASVVQADLLAYPLEPKDFEHPVRLLSDTSDHFFIAQSGLVSKQSAAPDHQTPFSIEADKYALDTGATQLEVPFTWTDSASGVTVRKVYVFKPGSYVIELRQEISNQGTAPWSGNAYEQLQRTAPATQAGTFAFNNPERFSFVGAAWYSPEKKFQKLRFDKYTGSTFTDLPITGGWAAMLQHYFFAAWIPAEKETNLYSTLANGTPPNQHYYIRTLGPALSVAPGGTTTTSARLYVGPKQQSTLNDVAPGLALTADYGIFTFIAEPLHWVLSWLHRLTGNWGFAIILLVLLIKAVFFKLSEAQYRSMAKMRKLAPRINALKERYGDDRQKFSQAQIELYQKEKINPLGGCLPMLVQFPVFIALYWVLIESVELRHAPFIGWIHNLTAPDPYFILPILNGATMIATQFLNPTTGMDPVQAKMMKAMPIMFAVMFAFFPAGLVLYWTVNGLASLIQQWIITRRIDAGEKA